MQKHQSFLLSHLTLPHYPGTSRIAVRHFSNILIVCISSLPSVHKYCKSLIRRWFWRSTAVSFTSLEVFTMLTKLVPTEQVTGSSNGTLVVNLHQHRTALPMVPVLSGAGSCGGSPSASKGQISARPSLLTLSEEAYIGGLTRDSSPLLWYFPCNGNGSNSSREGKMGI